MSFRDWLPDFFKIEERFDTVPYGNDNFIQGYDSLYIDGSTANPFQTAAVEYALNEVGRAFMAAEMTPTLPGIGPLVLSTLARQVLAMGNSVYRIEGNRQGIVLLPVVDYKVFGNASPDTWRYTFRQQRPNGDEGFETDQLPMRASPAAGIVHVRYMPRPEAPWQGISPLIAAGVTAQTLAYIERGLRYDASVPGGQMIEQPDGASDTAIKAAKAAITAGKGKTTLIETTSSGYGQGREAAPRNGWAQTRFGAEVPATSIDLREKSAMALIAALGAPEPGVEGAALRENFRHFQANTIASIAKLIAEELTLKLEREVKFYFPERVRSDIAATARGYNILRNTDPKWAADIVGLPEPPEADIIEPNNEAPRDVVVQPAQSNGTGGRYLVGIH